MKRLFIILAIAATLISGVPVLAQSTPPPQTKIQTEIIIPESQVERSAEGFARGKVQDLGHYIGLVYNFLIASVGVVAAVSMVWAGFRYLTAGGDAAKVGLAKKRMMNSIAGLVLALSAYLLLNTINPDLLKFKPLVIQSVTTQTLDYAKILGGSGTRGTACKTNADCAAPLTCLIVKEAPLEKGLRYFGTAIGVAISLPAAGGGSAVAGGKLLFNGAKLLVKYIGKAFVAAPLTTTAVGGVGGAVAWSAVSSLGYTGVCAQEAVNELNKGDWCARDSECKSPMHCLADPNMASFCGGLLNPDGTSAGACGVCSDGSDGSFCQPNSTNQCASPNICVQAATGVWFCSSGQQGSKCSSNGDCKGGTVCRQTGSIGGIGYCSAAQQGATGKNCKTSQDCSGESLNKICLKPTSNPNCDNDGSPSPCVCAPSSSGKTGSPCYCNDQCETGSHCETSDKKTGTFSANYCVGTLGSCVPGDLGR